MHLLTLAVLLVNAIVDIVLMIKKMTYTSYISDRKKEELIYEEETNVKLQTGDP